MTDQVICAHDWVEKETFCAMVRMWICRKCEETKRKTIRLQTSPGHDHYGDEAVRVFRGEL